jgi:hypothetical protein
MHTFTSFFNARAQFFHSDCTRRRTDTLNPFSFFVLFFQTKYSAFNYISHWTLDLKISSSIPSLCTTFLGLFGEFGDANI